MLSSADTLVQYDSKRKLIMSCDASEYGLGEELEHEMIMFVLRTMDVHERNYAQIDRGSNNIFYQYISERKLMKSNHRLLLGIFGPGKSIPNNFT